MSRTLFEKELSYLRAQEVTLRKNAEWCGLVDDLEAKFGDIFLTGSATYSVTASFNLNTVQDIVPVLRYLGQRNLRHKGVVKSSSSLTWSFHQPGSDKTVLTVNAYFRANGQCRQVQVGEKLVPVYEIRCGADLTKVEDLVIEEEAEIS